MAMTRECQMSLTSIMLNEQLHCLEPMFLNGVVQGSLHLNVLSIHVGTVLEKIAAQLCALHRVDQARAAVVVRLDYVGTILDEELNNIKVRHEARRAHGRRARIGNVVHVGIVPHQTLHHLQAAGDGRTPQRRDVVHRAIVAHLVEALLLDVGAALDDQIIHNLDVASLARNEQRRRGVIIEPADNALALLHGQLLQPVAQHVRQPRARCYNNYQELKKMLAKMFT